METERLIGDFKKKPTQTKKIAVKMPQKNKIKKQKNRSVSSKSATTIIPKTVTKANLPLPPKHPVAKKKSITPEEAVGSVSLPSNMSQRAIEKSVVFMQEVERHFGDAVYKIAYVGGLCFILVGGAFSVFSLAAVPLQQSAELISTTDNSLGAIPGTTPVQPDATTTTDGNQTTTTVYRKTEFQFLSTVPGNVVEPTTLSFFASYVYLPQVKIIAADSYNYVILPVEKIATDKYQVHIPLSLPANYYEVRVNLVPLNGDSSFVKRSNQFFVGTDSQEYLFNHPNETATATEEPNNSDTSTQVVEDPNESNSTADDGLISQTGEVDGETDVNEVVEDETQETDFVEPETDVVSPEQVNPPSVTLNLSSPMGTTISKGATLSLTVLGEPTSVELYARPVNALNARFIALAAKRLNGWIVTFDSNNLPNGDYEFFAKTKNSAGTVIVSKSIKLTVKNATLTTTIVTPIDTAEVVRPPVITITDTKVDSESPTTQPSLPVYAESDILIKENAEDLNTLFEHYAVAKQTGDESLIKAAQDSLNEKRETILLESSQDIKLRDSADRINNDLILKITDLQGRIDTFEELRKERSDGETAVDSDGDGISDVDEVQLYKTDPAVVDTDNDGVTDGVEIMRGYNPTDAKVEAIIRFESPKESIGLMRKDVLVVNEVVPLIADTVTENQPAVATEIKGRALPNSFVTLYIFSSPTVVTVKTDADGAFVYTFDKELDDGQHDVYVAITDNAGEIIAHSEPFSFIKEAQAFTPIAANESSIVTPPAVTENAAAGYNLAVGVGILALGLILLMLGINLRTKNDTKHSLAKFIE